jgi:hypothetical protein
MPRLLDSFEERQKQKEKIGEWARWLAKGLTDVQVSVWQILDWPEGRKLTIDPCKPPDEFFAAFPYLLDEGTNYGGIHYRKVRDGYRQPREYRMVACQRQGADTLYLQGCLVGARESQVAIQFIFKDREYLDTLFYEFGAVNNGVKAGEIDDFQNSVWKELFWQLLKIKGMPTEYIIEGYHPPFSGDTKLVDMADLRPKPE